MHREMVTFAEKVRVQEPFADHLALAEAAIAGSPATRLALHWRVSNEHALHRTAGIEGWKLLCHEWLAAAPRYGEE